MRFLTTVLVAVLLLGACGRAQESSVEVTQPTQAKVECSISCAEATVANYVKAVKNYELGLWLAGLMKPKPHISYNYSMWMAVHNCEQPNSWHAYGHFGNGLQSGGTGMGFSVDAVRMARGYAAKRGVYLPDGGSMSVDEQFEMAQAMLDATGSGPDCLRALGY